MHACSIQSRRCPGPPSHMQLCTLTQLIQPASSLPALSQPTQPRSLKLISMYSLFSMHRGCDCMLQLQHITGYIMIAEKRKSTHRFHNSSEQPVAHVPTTGSWQKGIPLIRNFKKILSISPFFRYHPFHSSMCGPLYEKPFIRFSCIARVSVLIAAGTGR